MVSLEDQCSTIMARIEVSVMMDTPMRLQEYSAEHSDFQPQML